MSVRSKVRMFAAVGAVALVGVANAATVPGQTAVIKDPGAGAVGTESKRSLTLLMKTGAGAGPGISGNPVTSGASLSVITAAGSQCFALPSTGWSGDATKGFKYKGKLVPGNPAVSAQFKQSGSGVFIQKTVLKGKSGPINDLLQANSANVIFSVPSGGDYCALWGGTISKNDQKLFKAVKSPAPGSCGPSACAGVCGNSIVNAGEACDTGGNSATCDSDCTAPVCGDGLTNTAAGEFCDTSGTDTSGCDAGDCSAPACGDGYFNAAAGEQCDSGGVDTAGCDGADCTVPTCGDSHVNAAAGEVCDPSGSSFGSGPPTDNGVCDGCLSPSGAFLNFSF